MSNLDNFDNLTPITTAFIDSDNSIQDLQAVLTSGAVAVTAVSPGQIVPIGEATTPKFDNITPWVGKFINPDNTILDLLQVLTSGAIQVQVIGGGGGGGAPTDATYITQSNELLALPNSIPLANLASGLLANTTGTGALTPVTLTGTANQLVVSGGDGSSTPTFSISPTLVLPGTLTLGGTLNTAGNAISQASGSMNLTAPTSIDLVTPWVAVNGLRHYGESTNKVIFSTGIQQFLPDNTLRMQLSSAGMQLGPSGATVSSISTDGTLGANSDTLLSTQKATKTFITTTNAATRGATFITTNDETAMLPNSTSTSGLANGFAMVYAGILGTQLLQGVSNQIDVAGGDASLSAATFSLSSTLVTPGSLDVGTTFSIGGTGAITSITTNPASISSTALMSASAVQAAISAAITAGTSFRGGWDASGGLYPTIGGSGIGGAVAAGDWWYITVAGTLNTTPVSVGDQIFALVATPGQTDANWLAVGQHVTSVFGRTGAITAQSGDYSFSQISGTAGVSQGGTGLTATGSNGNVLTSLSGAWVSAAPLVRSVFGRTGAIVAQTNDYSFSQISGTAAVSQGGTGITSPGLAGNVLTSDGAGNWVSSVPPSAPVSSVFGRTGAVVATSGDYSFSLISGTAAVGQGGTGLTATGADGNVLTASGGAWISAAPPSAPVSSVFGRTGAVTAQSGDYSFSLISGTATSAQGGTGFTTYTKGDVIHASAINTLSKLPIGTSGQVLTVSGGDAAWVDPIVSSVFGRTGAIIATSGDYSFSLISGTAVETQGGTNQTTYTKGDILHATAANTLSKLAIGSTGQVLTVVSGDAAWATLPTAPVTSVFGRTGAVVATSGDYSFSLISGTAGATQGGTGLTSYTIGDLLYASSSSALSKLAAVATGNVLLSGGVATAPSWGKVDLTAAVTGILPTGNGGTGNSSGQAASVANAVTFNNGGSGAASGTTFDGSAARTISYNTLGASPLAGSSSIVTVGTITSGTWNGTKISEAYGGTNQSTYTTGDILYASATNTLSKLAIGSSGQVLTVSGGVPSWAAASGGGGLTFNAVSSSTQALAVNNTYYTTFSGLNVMTLPSTAATGSIIQIIAGPSGNTFKVAQNAGQLIYYAAQNGVSVVTTTGTSGYLQSADPNTIVTLICVVANTTWQVLYANNNNITVN